MPCGGTSTSTDNSYIRKLYTPLRHSCVYYDARMYLKLLGARNFGLAFLHNCETWVQR